MKKTGNVTELRTRIFLKKILIIVGNVLFYTIIILLFLFSLMNINAGNGERDFPNLFGRGMLNVMSNSMERNEDYKKIEWASYSIGEIKKGDLVYVKKFKSTTVENLSVGDVITFVDEINLKGNDTLLNTHRIVSVNIDNNYVLCQGDYYVSLRESNDYVNMTPMDFENAVSAGNLQVVQCEDIKGIVTSVKSGAGKVLTNIRQNWLFYFVIPVAIVLVLELFFVFKNILDLRNEKAKVALADNEETMKNDLKAQLEAEMREQILAEMRAQRAAMANNAPEPVKEEAAEVVAEVTEEPAVEEVSEDITNTEEKTEE